MWSWLRGAVLLPFALASTAPIDIPSASSGVINGRTAILVWPAGPNNRPVDASGCAVHLVPYTDQDAERTYPCGEWFQPDVGKYRYWLEKDDAYISPYPSILYYAGRPFEGRSLRLLLPVLPAGKVALLQPQSPNLSFRIVHLPASGDRPAAHRSFDRRARADKTAPLLTPVGAVVAALFDRQGNATAVTRPVRVQRDELQRVLPTVPKVGTDILAVLEREGVRAP